MAIWSAKRVQARPWAILVMLSVVTAVFSALLDNVTTVLLIAPVTLLITDVPLLKKSLAVLGLVIAAFVFAGPLRLEPATIAMFGAALLLLVTLGRSTVGERPQALRGGRDGSLVGASANLIVAGMAERARHRIRFLPFMMLVFPIMLLGIVIASVYVSLR